MTNVGLDFNCIQPNHYFTCTYIIDSVCLQNNSIFCGLILMNFLGNVDNESWERLINV